MIIKQIISNFNKQTPCKIYNVAEQNTDEHNTKLYTFETEYATITDIEDKYLDAYVCKVACLYSKIIFYINISDAYDDKDLSQEAVVLDDLPDNGLIYFENNITIVPINPKPITVKSFFEHFKFPGKVRIVQNIFDSITTCTAEEALTTLSQEILDSDIDILSPYRLYQLSIFIGTNKKETDSAFTIDELILLTGQCKIYEETSLDTNSSYYIDSINYNKHYGYFTVKTVSYEQNDSTD